MEELFLYPQWNLSNPDTLGTEESVLINMRCPDFSCCNVCRQTGCLEQPYVSLYGGFLTSGLSYIRCSTVHSAVTRIYSSPDIHVL